jgi:hypothetical protein
MNVVIDGVRYVPAPTPCEKPELLDFVFFSEDLDRDLTIREYLVKLLWTLWNDGEGFSGKRPYGNSGWEFELYAALLKAQAIEGELDEDGRVHRLPEASRSQADAIIFGLIDQLGAPPKP